jgi:arylsulfatase A-like enzyme
MPLSRRAFLSSLPALSLAAPKPRPNFLFVLADDLGWADLPSYGSSFHETPNLDRLASSACRFTNAYSACPVCSPTRASIMTGRYPARVGITDYLPGLPSTNRKLKTPEDLGQLPLEEVTFAEVLKQNGYQTFYGGKWHLRTKGTTEFSPLEQGFDHYIDEGRGPQDPTGGPRYTDGALKFLDARDSSKPFFAFLGFNEVHMPMTPRDRWLDHFTRKAAALPPLPQPSIPERNGFSRLRQDNPVYASMLADLDHHTGRLLAKLDQLRLTDNTVVVFVSDNGGLCTHAKLVPASNAPLRSGKGWLYEGGIRVPFLLRAPGLTRPASTCDTPVITTDFFPTILQLAGLPLQPKLHIDGQPITEAIRPNAKPSPRTLYWHYPHYHGSTWAPGGALRDGNWKLIEFFEENQAELYRLDNDISERKDLAAAEPARLKSLQTKLAAWRQEVGAIMPVPQ